MALLEAMNYGNCCLASDIPENLEALENNGYTFHNRDVADLCRILNELIKNPQKVEEKKIPAVHHVRCNYSWVRVADEMESLYRSILESQKSN